MKTTTRSKAQRTALGAFIVALAAAGLVGGFRLVASPTITATTVAAGTDNAASPQAPAATSTTPLAADTPAPTPTVTVTSTKATTFAMPKAGAKCPLRLRNKIVGVPTSTGGTTFLKCALRTKGLIWVKTKAPVLTVPTATPTPTRTSGVGPTPTPTPTRTSGVGPTPTPTPTTTPTGGTVSTTPNWAGYIEPQFKIGKVTNCVVSADQRTVHFTFELVAYNGNFYGNYEGKNAARITTSEQLTGSYSGGSYLQGNTLVASSDVLFISWPFNYSGSGSSGLTPKSWRVQVARSLDLASCS